MSVLGVFISDSFVELATSNKGAPLGDREFLPKVGLSKVLQQWKDRHANMEVTEVVLGSTLCRQLIRKKLGSHMAVLTTAGFESWLKMSMPIESDQFSVQPQRIDFPFASDLIFGINERMGTQGQVIKPLDVTELEFLESKLKLNEIKNVAVGFLNSTKNPSHEDQVFTFFKERGFNVFSSSSLGVNSVTNEKSRWIYTILSAFTHSALNDQWTTWKTSIQSVWEGVPVKFYPTQEGEIFDPLRSLTTDVDAAAHFLRIHGLEEGLYCGLEKIFWVRREASNSLRSEYGLLPHLHPRSERLLVQPTTEISKDPLWGISHLGRSELGFEPGPVFLGRGLKLSVFDVLQFKQPREKWPVMGEVTKDEKALQRGQARVSEAFQAQARDEMKGEFLDLPSEMKNFILRKILRELRRWSPDGAVLFGPMAKTLIENLRELSKGLELQLLDSKINGELALGLTHSLTEKGSPWLN